MQLSRRLGPRFRWTGGATCVSAFGFWPGPGVLGHEGAGIVVGIGPDVSEVGPGDRVVIGWPFCGHCAAGEPRYCLRLAESLVGGARLDGATALHRRSGEPLSSHFFGQSSFASHAVTTARALVKVPVGLPLELMGPLACGVSTGAGAVFNTARPGPGSSVVVFGVGTVGLSAVMAAKLSPATRIVAVDRHRSRLRLARELGATHTVDANENGTAAAILEICGGPANFALECTGVVEVVRQAADSVGMLGTCILIGGAPAGAQFELDHLSTLWGKKIVGILGGGGQSQPLISTIMQLYQQDRFPFDRLVQYFDFDDIAGAVEASYDGRVINRSFASRSEPCRPHRADRWVDEVDRAPATMNVTRGLVRTRAAFELSRDFTVPR